MRCSGVVSTVRRSFHVGYVIPVLIILGDTRCTAIYTNLDGDHDAVSRSHEHTRKLLATFNLKTLWDDYRLVGDLVVCCFLVAIFTRADSCFDSHLLLAFHEPTFTSCYHPTFCTK